MKASYVSGITDSEIELFFPFFQIEHFLPRMFQVSGDEYQVLLCKKFSSILVMLVKLKKNEKKKKKFWLHWLLEKKKYLLAIDIF